MSAFYTGVPVDRAFMDTWRSNRQIGADRPTMRVQIRRGRLERRWHDDWPDPQFGQFYGKPINHQFYPVWTPLDDWTDLPGVHQVELSQAFSNNGLNQATVMADNIQWAEHSGFGIFPYHSKERGYLWPWRGWVPPSRPGINVPRNDWYARLPNAQILITQGYGDNVYKTFTGLIDGLRPTVRPDHMQIVARDFGGILVDSYVFGWNKEKDVNDPLQFVPPHYKGLAKIAANGAATGHRLIIVKDVCDIVRCALRWCGFNEWQIQDSGVNLSTVYVADKTKSWMDVINDVGQSIGYQFFMSEPTEGNDLSIGVPIFRQPTVLTPQRSAPITLTSHGRLTDDQPVHSNTDERYIIRVRGNVNKQIGRTAGGDSVKRVQFCYWPPWMKRMAGVIKQLTYYDTGATTIVGFQTIQECAVAAVLVAVQIALGLDTDTVQCPGQPAFGLDSTAYLIDEATGVNSRLYITNRHSTMTLGGDGGSSLAGGSASSLLWATELGGSLVDNPDFETVLHHYQLATAGITTFSWDYGYD